MTVRTVQVPKTVNVDKQLTMCDRCGAEGIPRESGVFKWGGAVVTINEWVETVNDGSAAVNPKSGDLCPKCSERFHQFMRGETPDQPLDQPNPPTDDRSSVSTGGPPAEWLPVVACLVDAVGRWVKGQTTLIGPKAATVAAVWRELPTDWLQRATTANKLDHQVVTLTQRVETLQGLVLAMGEGFPPGSDAEWEEYRAAKGHPTDASTSAKQVAELQEEVEALRERVRLVAEGYIDGSDEQWEVWLASDRGDCRPGTDGGYCSRPHPHP